MKISKVATILSRRQSTKVVLLLCILFFIPLLNNLYLNTILISIGFYSIVTMGFILLMGFAGQISLGQAIFFGLGAYISGILTVNYDLSPWLTLVLATFTTGCIAMLLGRVIFRLRGLIVGGITLALNLVFYHLVQSMSGLTGGATGMMNIPRLPSGGFLSYSLFIYYIVWTSVFLLLVFSLNLVNSRVGRALKAMNLFSGGSDVTAQVMGINIMKYKAGIFAVSAMYASLAGSIYAQYLEQKGLIKSPHYFNLIFGNIACAQADLLHAGIMIHDLPDNSFWSIGRYVHIGSFVSVIGGGELLVGDYAAIACGSRIITGTDTYYDGKRMSAALPASQRNVIAGKVVIEKDAFIGTNVVIHPNVTIGEGAIIGSNSLVIKDVEPWTINVGSPCKKIGMRPKVTEQDI